MKYTTVHSRVEHIAGQYPQRTAVEEGTRSLTYAAVSKYSNQLAHTILSLGDSMPGPVAVLMPGGINLVLSLLGILKSGHIYLPVSPDSGIDRLRQVLQQCRPRILITTSALLPEVREKLSQTEHQVAYLLVLDEDARGALYHISADGVDRMPDPLKANTEEVAVSVDGEDSSYIFYTSGSTGTAKAILGTHKGLYHFIEWEITTFQINKTVRVSQLINPVFDASLRDIFVPLCAGGCLCIPSVVERENVFKLVSWIAENRITLIHCVPSLLRIITKAVSERNREVSFPALSHVLVSGEVLYVKDIVQWRQHIGANVQLVNFYGATETTMIKMYHCIGEVDEENPTGIIPVGKPISNTVAAIVNDDHICRTGEVGEIYIKTAFWTKGYFLDQELQQRVFVQNPLVKDRTDIVYKTGDLGRYLKDNIIEVLGRIDNQVKVNGVRVDISEVERAILLNPAITGIIVISRVNKQQQTDLVAYYTGTQLTTEQLRKSLHALLHPASIPAYYHYLPEFPLTITGKIDRKALPVPDEIIQEENHYEAVQYDTEMKLETIWKEVLDIRRIGRKFSFFQAGGTSLKAIQLISRIYKEWGVLIKVADIFSNPTIGQMALLIDGVTGKRYTAIVPVADSDRYAATHQQKRLWLLGQFEDKRKAYNMPAAFLLRGSIDKSALAAAFMDLVNRHESLRTTFEMSGDELWQKIHQAENLQVELEIADVSTADDAKKATEEIIAQEAGKEFDLAKGPLFRMKLIQQDGDTHCVFINIHHIIADAWSLHIMARDMLSYYLHRIGHLPENPAPLRIQYKDYSAWQNDQLFRTADEHRKFWDNCFEDEPPLLELPLDFPRPAQHSFNGRKYHFRFDEKMAADIADYNHRTNTTLFMVLAGAVNLFLYGRSGQNDIVVGIPFAGRDHQDLEEQIGFYVNTVAIRTKIEPEIPLGNFILQIKQELLQAHNHSIWPFDKVAAVSARETDMSRSGFFDVMIQMQEDNARALSMNLPEYLHLEQLNLEFNTSKFDLTFNFEKNASNQLLGWIQYNTGLFLESTVADMQHALVFILSHITAHETVVTARELKKQLAELKQDTADSRSGRFFNAAISEDF